MTVTVTRRGGATDKYLRFGDSYVKNNDGTLDVVHSGATRPYRYAPGEWTEVQGDEKKWTRSHFWS
ncbi:uncharacterized protein RMCN_1661 [Mycobacterium numidiamassiliense]|uniref:Uncharacterized protein RMCN_1661 n=2 Tax=Mycobacterium numidiamassiliense TaxID=1841861 RepID=A0A2U3PGI6_9MYCO|nr:hypothetical protein [Mycobacterium numidiamassiliense]SPM42886.1 uncharacterized protein RMCN_1661 [Mycobacterium numidiamassiliense]